jgi:fibronectin type 3 domain-containing protein
MDFAATDTREEIRVQWNASPSPDVRHYLIYRGTSDNFPVDEEHYLASTSGTAYDDLTAGLTHYFYRVVPVDYAGNHGRPSAPVLAGISSVSATTGSDAVFSVGDIYPQPASGIAMIPVHTITAVQVQVMVYNELGEQVTAVTPTVLAGGDHSLQLDVSTLSSGVYHCIVQAGNETQSVKLVVHK